MIVDLKRHGIRKKVRGELAKMANNPSLQMILRERLTRLIEQMDKGEHNVKKKKRHDCIRIILGDVGGYISFGDSIYS